MAQKKSGGGRNDARKNGKAWKKKPGPAKMEKTNYDHVNGRNAESHAKREAWKLLGGQSYHMYCGKDCNHPKIPHWKTGKIHGRDKSEKVHV